MPDPYETIRPASTPASGEAGPAGKARRKMTPEATLGTALLAFAAANGLPGLLMLAFPRALWVSIGSADALYAGAYSSTRFAGALMVTVALAALLVIRRPAGQSTLVTILCIGETLVGIATLLTAVADNPPTAAWFDWPVALVTIALALFMWWARFMGRRALKAV